MAILNTLANHKQWYNCNCVDNYKMQKTCDSFMANEDQKRCLWLYKDGWCWLGRRPLRDGTKET